MMTPAGLKKLVENLCEKLEISGQENKQLKDENTELKNRLRELIGEHELPEFKEKKEEKKNSKNRDPNPEYKQPKNKAEDRGKRGKRNQNIKVDKKVKLNADKSTMPDDIQFKGTRKIIIQDIELRTNNIEFEIPRFYSPSNNKYYEPPLPEGFKGYEFGPALRSFVLMLNHQARVTENKIHSILTSIGTLISVGHINNITQTIPLEIKEELLKAKDAAIEKEAINIDGTGIKINGDARFIQCICNKFFSWFDLVANKSRYEVVRTIIGRNYDLLFTLDEEAFSKIRNNIKNKSVISGLRKYIREKPYNSDELEDLVKSLSLGDKHQNYLKVSSLLRSYRQGLFGPVSRGIISDDANEYKKISKDHQLCWIHELRHYRMITIETSFWREKLDLFFDRAWSLFENMQDYRSSPSTDKRKYIEKEFKELFEIKWDCYPIDTLQKNTIARKRGLLRFLDSPWLEIHNNRCEFDIREKVVKKKISYGHKSVDGCHNGNFWLSLYHTCRKNNVEFWKYLKDRYCGENIIPQLSDIIQAS